MSKYYGTPLRDKTGLMLNRVFALAAVCLLPAVAQTKYQPTWESIDSRPIPGWFQDSKFGIFIHWGVYSVPSYAKVGSYAEWYWRNMESGRSAEKKDANQIATWAFHQKNYGPDFPYQNFAPMF